MKISIIASGTHAQKLTAARDALAEKVNAMAARDAYLNQCLADLPVLKTGVEQAIDSADYRKQKDVARIQAMRDQVWLCERQIEKFDTPVEEDQKVLQPLVFSVGLAIEAAASPHREALLKACADAMRPFYVDDTAGESLEDAAAKCPAYIDFSREFFTGGWGAASTNFMVIAQAPIALDMADRILSGKYEWCFPKVPAKAK